MIKIKPCKCGCGKQKTFNSGGYYWDHMPEEMKAKKQSKRKEQEKRKNAATYAGNKLLKEQMEATGESELVLWYKVKMQLNEPRCAECGAYKPELKQWEKGWHACQAHLLPKKNFKSISTHPLNCLVLGAGFSGLCYCHDIYDSSWAAASKMKIWPEVCRRFLILYPLIKPDEYKFIPDVLNELLQTQMPNPTCTIDND